MLQDNAIFVCKECGATYRVNCMSTRQDVCKPCDDDLTESLLSSEEMAATQYGERIILSDTWYQSEEEASYQ